MEIINTDRVDRIRTCIELLAYDLDTTNCVDLLRKRWLAEGLTDFVVAALSKFITGQKEHGGEFEEVNGTIAATEETIDLFFYLRKCTHPMPRDTFDPTNQIIPQ